MVLKPVDYLNTKQIYFDYNATTPPHPDVLKEASRWLKIWGNPSSIYKIGRDPKKYLRQARQQIADFLGVEALELIFTSSGSESNNLAIKGVYNFLKTQVQQDQPIKNQFIYSAVEHPSVRETMKYLEALGAEVIQVPVDSFGNIDIEFYKKHLSERTALVSVMFANNETGNVFPIKELAELAHNKRALFHCDGVQSLGKAEVCLRDWDVDYCSFSAHKVYSLKGCGVLYQKKGSPLLNLIHGGRQERRRRAGTENILPIISLGYVLSSNFCSKEKQREQHERMKNLRDNFEFQILEKIKDVYFNGSKAKMPRISNTSNFSVKGVDGDILLMSLDVEGFAVSTGAACSSGSSEPNTVLLAMGLSHELSQSSLRVSLGWQTTQEEVDQLVKVLVKAVERIRSLRVEKN